MVSYDNSVDDNSKCEDEKGDVSDKLKIDREWENKDDIWVKENFSEKNLWKYAHSKINFIEIVKITF